MPSATPIRLVLVGAGHTHVEVLRRFGAKPPRDVTLTLLTRARHTPYSGMLPGLVAGLYRFEETHIDVEALARHAGAALLLDEAVGLDLRTRQVRRRGGEAIPFDLLSLDIGSTPNTPAIPGADAHAIPVKPIDGFLARFEGARERILARGGDAALLTVGGGAGGVELILAVERRLRGDLARAGHDPGRLRLALVTRSRTVLPGAPTPMQARFARVLAQRGIRVVTDAPVSAVGPEGVEIGKGRVLEADEILWTTQAIPAPWLRDTGLALDGSGFVRVAATLESPSHRGVFAAGDVACFDPRPLPKAGVFAVRQGPVLAENLRRIAEAKPLVRYRPQRNWLELISTGERHAIGTRNGFVAEGDWVWRVKDWIDRRFMSRYRDLPPR
jgi:selenide,water dikinase